jgi:Ca2+-dependent lipid-binding protein
LPKLPHKRKSRDDEQEEVEDEEEEEEEDEYLFKPGEKKKSKIIDVEFELV